MSGVWVLFPYVGAIRLSTVLAFLLTLAVVTWYRRSLITAVAVSMGWVCGFEIAYQTVALIEGQGGVTAMHLFYLTFSFSGWVVAAHLAGARPHPVLLLAWGLVLLGWAAIGFHPNGYGQPGFSLGQEILNVVAKDGLAAIYLIGILAPFRLREASKVQATTSHSTR